MEYISKQSLLADLNEATPRSYFAFETMVREYPTEDVAPVVHAHWIDDGYYADFHPHKVYRCSNCDWSKLDVELPEEKYCPHCGAKMDEEQ